MTVASLVLGWIALCLALAIQLAGGITVRVGALTLRAHDAVWAAVAGIVLLAIAWRRARRDIDGTLAGVWSALEHRAAWIAGVSALLAAAIGINWGTYVVGGSDSYCYMAQAELIASGRLQDIQPFGARAPWPNAMKTLAPVGFVPAAAPANAIAPACPPGFPLLVASARLAGGRPAMFLVVPLLGALAVWCTFLLGHRTSGALAGAIAAALIAVSPVFLYQIVQPMTDVPATAFWTAALVAALGPARPSSALLSGVLSGAALLVRPNLLPLAALVLATSLFARPLPWRRRVTLAIAFGAALVPFAAAIAILNVAMHGGALESGYGNLTELFTVANIRGNLARYPRWLVETQTPVILVAAIAPWLLPDAFRRRAAWLLLGFAAATFVCYLPYTVWNAWWFVRFVLPALPPLLVLSSAVALALIDRVPARWRMAILATSLGGLIVFQLVTAEARAVFRLRDLEARYRQAGEYVARALPQNAVLFADVQSGSVRFYSGRPTIAWTWFDEAWFDRTLAFLRAEGYRPYLLFESDEEPEFKRRFGPASALGTLAWPPKADIAGKVKIYDPDDRERYLQGARIATEFLWNP